MDRRHRHGTHPDYRILQQDHVPKLTYVAYPLGNSRSWANHTSIRKRVPDDNQGLPLRSRINTPKSPPALAVS